MPSLQHYLQKTPVIAILRGIRPAEISAVAGILLDSGITAIEVPLNSPDALQSIRQLRALCGDRAICGAGTVTNVQQVRDVASAGGQLIVAPNTNPAVIKEALARGLEVAPGCATASEAFTAIEAGASYLKFFSAGDIGAGAIRSIMAVLPPSVSPLAVGNIHEGNLAEFWAAGVRSFGVGSNVYTPGKSIEAIAEAASAVVATVRALQEP